MKITSVNIKPEKKTADVWDAVTETEVQNNAGTDLPAHSVPKGSRYWNTRKPARSRM